MSVRKRGRGEDGVHDETGGSRKSRTRQALLDAALDLMAGEDSFTSLSLREVTRQAGVVPAAFYRHFPDMSSLGLELVDESFRALRAMMRDARSQPLPTEQMLRRSAEVYVHHVRNNARHFRFVSKEFYSGSTAIRFAIRNEIRLLVSELATDLALLLPGRNITGPDLQMMAGVVVNNMVTVTSLSLDVPEDHLDELQSLIELSTRQLRLIFLGVSAWESQRQ